METAKQRRFLNTIRLLHHVFGIGVLCFALWVTYMVFDQNDADEPMAWVTIGLLLLLGWGLLRFAQVVGGMRAFPEHRTAGMLDDLELAGDGDTRIAGVPVWAVVVGILALIGTAMLVIFSAAVVMEVSDSIARDIRRGRDLDGQEVLAFLSGILGAVSGVSAVIFTLTNLRLKVLKPLEHEL